MQRRASTHMSFTNPAKSSEVFTLTLHVDFGGLVQWVSPSWIYLVGTSLDSVRGESVSDIFMDEKNMFHSAMNAMKEDPSCTCFVEFAVKISPNSILHCPTLGKNGQFMVQTNRSEDYPGLSKQKHDNVLCMEAQGAVISNSSCKSGAFHSIWIAKPSSRQTEYTLSPFLYSIGSGVQLLAQYVTTLADAAEHGRDTTDIRLPDPVLCHICDRKIMPWWYEKHSSLCLRENMIGMDIQAAQERLIECRQAIIRILHILNNRHTVATGSRSAVDFLRQLRRRSSIQSSHLLSERLPWSSHSAESTSSFLDTLPVLEDESLDKPSDSLRHGRRLWINSLTHIFYLCGKSLQVGILPFKTISQHKVEREITGPLVELQKYVSHVLKWHLPGPGILKQRDICIVFQSTIRAAKAKSEAVSRHLTLLQDVQRARAQCNLLAGKCLTAAFQEGRHGLAKESVELSYLLPESLFGVDHRKCLAFDKPTPNINSCTITDNSSVKALDLASSSATEWRCFDQVESTALCHSTSAPCLLDQPPLKSQESLAILSKDHNRPVFYDQASRSDAHRMQLENCDFRCPKDGRHQCHSTRDMLPPVRKIPAGSGERANQLRYFCHNFTQSHNRLPFPNVANFPLLPALTSANELKPNLSLPSITDFIILKPISRGAFGTVYLSQKKTTKGYFAIKVLKRSDMVAKNQVAHVKTERAVMIGEAESEFVAKLYWAFSSKEHFYLVMEYLNGGDCANLIKTFGPLSEEWAKMYIAEIVLGVEHLHSRGIVHRDLKPDNLLISQAGHIKFTDFGLSCTGLFDRQQRILRNTMKTEDLLQHPFSRISLSTNSVCDPKVIYPLDISKEKGGSSGSSSFAHSQSNCGGFGLIQQRNNEIDPMDGSLHTTSFSQTSPVPASLSFKTCQHLRTPKESQQSQLVQLLSKTGDNYPETMLPNREREPRCHSARPPLFGVNEFSNNETDFVGTPDYMAPESLLEKEQSGMSDWWSVGVITFELLFGYPPFNAPTPTEVFENILARKIQWPAELKLLVTENACDFMDKLMAADPKHRLGAGVEQNFFHGSLYIRAHPWLSEINWDTLFKQEGYFIPHPEHPEDTDYFDHRGATLKDLMDSPDLGEFHKSRIPDVQNLPLTAGSLTEKDLCRSPKESVVNDDFDSFAFKNLPMLKRYNDAAIQKICDVASKITKIVN